MFESFFRTDGPAGEEDIRHFHIRVRTVRVQGVCSGRTLLFGFVLLFGVLQCSSISDELCANRRTLDIGNAGCPLPRPALVVNVVKLSLLRLLA